MNLNIVWEVSCARAGRSCLPGSVYRLVFDMFASNLFCCCLLLRNCLPACYARRADRAAAGALRGCGPRRRGGRPVPLLGKRIAHTPTKQQTGGGAVLSSSFVSAELWRSLEMIMIVHTFTLAVRYRALVASLLLPSRLAMAFRSRRPCRCNDPLGPVVSRRSIFF